MENSQVEQQIRTYLVDNFLFGRSEALTENSTLLGGMIDSTGIVELVMFLQDRFGITIEDDEVAVPANFDSLGHLVALVEGKLRARA